MKFKFWYVPQIPGAMFEREFDLLIDAVRALNIVIDFSIFEYENRIKPDYADAAGVAYWDSNDQDWYDVLYEDLEYDDEMREQFGLAGVWDSIKTELEILR
jgi:hypothetical protein